VEGPAASSPEVPKYFSSPNSWGLAYIRRQMGCFGSNAAVAGTIKLFRLPFQSRIPNSLLAGTNSVPNLSRICTAHPKPANVLLCVALVIDRLRWGNTALGCDSNWSMQHLTSQQRQEDVADEVRTSDQHAKADEAPMWDAGSKASRRARPRACLIATKTLFDSSWPRRAAFARLMNHCEPQASSGGDHN